MQCIIVLPHFLSINNKKGFINTKSNLDIKGIICFFYHGYKHVHAWVVCARYAWTEHDNALEWNEAKHWFHDQEQELEFDSEFQDVSLKSLKWIATLGVGGFGRVELVTLGANRNNAFALKKMKKSEVCGKLATLK